MATRTLNPKMHYATAYYDFAIDGGAVGLITPKTTSTIPEDALVLSTTIESILAVTGGGNMQLHIGAVDFSGSHVTAKLTAGAAQGGLYNNTLLPKVVAAAGTIGIDCSVAITGQGKFLLTVGYLL